MIQKISVQDEAHNAFVKSHSNGDLGQLTYWGELKKINGWKWVKVNVGEDEKHITGAALLLFKKIPKLNLTFCYANRGFVVDWSDRESTKALTEATVETAKEHNAIMVRIDPDLDEHTEGLLEAISSLGFRHKGLEKGLYAYTQPRYHAVTDLSPDLDTVFKTFQSRTRTNVRKSLKNGLVLEDAPFEKMKEFYEIMKITGDRDDFSIRGLDYFQRMYQVLSPSKDVNLFLVKLLPEVALKNLEEDLSKRNKELSRLEKKEQDENTLEQKTQIQRAKDNTLALIEEMRKLMEEYPEGKYLSGAIFTLCGVKAYYLYGASSNQYRDLLPNYFMQWEMMCYAKEQGATSYDFGGISGREGELSDEAPGLWEFKKRWGAEAIGRIGEFDYVLKPFWYRLMEWALKIRKSRHHDGMGA